MTDSIRLKPAKGQQLSVVMPSTDQSQLRQQLRDLFEDYAACIDDRELERWPDFFSDDALYRVIARENYDAGLTHAAMYCDGISMIRDRVVAIRETTVYEPRALRHFVSGVRVLGIDGDVVKATANFMIVEALANSEPRLSLVGRYIDTLVGVDGSWLFKDRSCVYDNYRIHTSLIFPV